jgi:hypothetical protein
LSTDAEASARWTGGAVTLARGADSLCESEAELQPAAASTKALAATRIRVRLRTLRISPLVAVRSSCPTAPALHLTASACHVGGEPGDGLTPAEKDSPRRVTAA